MSEPLPVAVDEKLLHATVKLNTLLFAAVCGFMGGATLFCATLISLNGGSPDPGHILDLLGVFLPGYQVSTAGAWIGLLWGCVLGAVAGAVIYRIYARGIRAQVADYFAGTVSERDLEYAVLRLDGHSLGLALGSLAGLGLLITTNWLVVRGTADESVHAALFAHYLPGYAVSASGSILGAVDIFVVTYLFCLILGLVYNRVVAMRQPGAA